MLLFGEAFLSAIVYVSSAIATLRAGSRLLYILKHGHIGVMDGPLILGPLDSSLKPPLSLLNITTNNATSENEASLLLWEYTSAFQQAVRLSLGNQESYILTQNKNLRIDHLRKEDPISFDYDTSLDSSAMKDLTKRGFRLQLLNELIQGYMVNKVSTNISFPQRLHMWYHYWIDPMILGILKMTTSSTLLPTTRKETPRYRLINSKKKSWDYEEVLESIVKLPSSRFPLNDEKNQKSIRIAKIKAYAPNVFYDLRRRFGINPSSFVRSIFSSGPFVSFQSNSKGAARSGGFFFFTRDGMFMIKTIKATEMNSLRRMLPKYHKYMMQYSKRSLLTRFCGVYGIELLHMNDDNSKQRTTKDTEQFFVIMNSVFPVEGSKFITERFDIKGSVVGRTCSMEEIKTKKNLAVYKDMDLIGERGKYSQEKEDPHNTRISFGERVKSTLIDQLRHDVGLLMSCEVMDYSLLMGIVILDDGQKAKRNDMVIDKYSCVTALRVVSSPLLFLGHKIVSTGENLLSSIWTFPFPYYGADLCGVDCGTLSRIEGRRHGKRAIFYLGLIDFLQPWTTRKVIERELKGLVGYNKQLISCVHPHLYASRFLDFVDENTS